MRDASRATRLALSALVLVASGLAASRARAVVAPSRIDATCSRAAVARAFPASMQLDHVDGYGCAAGWAYAWATVGRGAAEISVTEVLRLSPGAGWTIVSRAQTCYPTILPALIYRRGCFSN